MIYPINLKVQRDGKGANPTKLQLKDDGIEGKKISPAMRLSCRAY
ncbi:hypothetical protein [Xenorhabdus sp. Sc-CR9]|nr:hypothetical protein [Xenorhabdus sp. Sc-CR9]